MEQQEGRPRRRKGQKWSADERAEAVRVFRASRGRSIRAVADDLGVPFQTLYRWVTTAREIELDPSGTLTDAARRRVRKLEEENARLRRELDFEKKARAFVQEISRRRNDSR
jgi:transposase-like protein